MSHQAQWYPTAYGPSGSCGCGQGAGPGGQYIAYVPVVYAPAVGYGTNTIPQELTVDAASSPRDALVGGRSDVRLTLESIVDTGAPAPQVKVTVTSGGSTSTWTETPPPGYHVKEAFLNVKPGAKVTVEVTDALARLRWCETVCC